MSRLTLAAWVGWGLFAVLNGASGGRPKTVALDVVVLLGIGASHAVLTRWPAAWRGSMHATAALSVAGLVIASWWSGSVEAIAWWYLAAAPLFASHAGGRRAGLAWSIGCAAAVVVAIQNPFSFLPEFIPSVVDRAAGGIVLVCICTAFGWLARQAVDAQIGSLVDAARQKSELLASISHEIRTPLHGILGIASVLGETSLSSDQRDLLTALRSSGKTLNRIVDDVLDVARLEAGRIAIEPSPVDLLSTLEDLIDLYAPDASGKGVELVLLVEGSQHFRVLADEIRVRQIVSNLVGNAVKFTEAGSVIVRAAATPEGELIRVAVHVEDTGPGIPAARIDRLFVPYDRLDTHQAKLHGGTGLGLALARDLALRMGGALSVDRARAVGARLSLEVTFAPAPEGAAVEPAPETDAVALIVEAEPLHAAATRSTARALGGVQVLVSESAEAAAALARGRRIDVVVVCASRLLDPALAKNIIQASVDPHTPIVVGLSPANVTLHGGARRQFSGTAMRPLRRSRMRVLFDEAALVNEAPAIVQTHRTALAIDDDAINRRILVRLLEARRWNVVAVDSARAGLEALGERLFDAVLCDLHMPHQSGTELLAQAKQRGFQSYFAAVTASVREADRLLCIEAGFDGFLRKPFEIEELDEILIAAARKSKISSTIGSAGSASTSEELLDMAMWRKVEELVGSEADSLLRDHEQSARAHVAVIVERPGDDDDVERAAHTLASSSLTIGLRLLGETARTLELTVRGLDEAERRAQGRRLSKLLDASIPALARARAGPVATAPALPTPEAAPRPEPSLLRAVFTGHVDAKMVESALGRARITAPAGANAMIVDCRDMAGYEPEARRAFEAWHLRHRADLVGVAVLTDNAIWATLASAIGTLTGQAIRAFRDEPEAIRWLESRRKDSRATQERSHP